LTETRRRGEEKIELFTIIEINSIVLSKERYQGGYHEMKTKRLIGKVLGLVSLICFLAPFILVSSDLLVILLVAAIGAILGLAAVYLYSGCIADFYSSCQRR